MKLEGGDQVASVDVVPESLDEPASDEDADEADADAVDEADGTDAESEE